ncbi:MAG: transcription antitermination factor NusB [Candidatus Woykebacteria bacterium RBG_13_40_15]|uniref:Transcription antitermination protein NusB n=1 Tax=Candidatus Woykebacteria bacterium RBG_13_40_15 TaxID=1802593 RepID=A0A1G1W6Z0_9BACT|nr:MAG: transcription antitermination factor NusB [Candidatus Woykebacteria bacterium RBG_13_40_15]
MKAKHDPRHQARILALQSLFEWSFNSIDIKEIIRRNLEDLALQNQSKEAAPEVDSDLANFLIKGSTENLDTIDKIIESCASEWPISQIAKVDLEILRIAIFELYIARNSPPKVAIDEAVELAKEFGGENSSKFVNGVLGTVVKQLMPEVN